MKKQTVLITGASGGIGLELATLFERNGHDLVLVARSKDKLDEAASAFQSHHGITVHTIVHDLSRTDSARALYEEVRRRGISIDVLINNAGAGTWGEFWQTDLARETEILQLNVVSLVQLTKLFLQDMIKNRNGKILNVASTAAFQAGPLMAVYYASKALVLSFTEALANETRGSGVTVCALCPGPTETNFRSAAGMKKSMLFSRHLNLPSTEVARVGYEGLKRGKTVIIPGFKNRLIVQMLRLLPRSFTVDSVRKMQEARR